MAVENPHLAVHQPDDLSAVIDSIWNEAGGEQREHAAAVQESSVRAGLWERGTGERVFSHDLSRVVDRSRYCRGGSGVIDRDDTPNATGPRPRARHTATAARGSILFLLKRVKF